MEANLPQSLEKVIKHDISNNRNDPRNPSLSPRLPSQVTHRRRSSGCVARRIHKSCMWKSRLFAFAVLLGEFVPSYCFNDGLNTLNECLNESFVKMWLSTSSCPSKSFLYVHRWEQKQPNTKPPPKTNTTCHPRSRHKEGRIDECWCVS